MDAEVQSRPVTRRAASVALPASGRAQPLPPPLRTPSVAAVRFAAAFDSMAAIAGPLMESPVGPAAPAGGVGGTVSTPPASQGDFATPIGRIIAVAGERSPIICRLGGPTDPPAEVPTEHDREGLAARTAAAGNAEALGMHADDGTVMIPLEPGHACITMHAAASVIRSTQAELAQVVRQDHRAAQAREAGGVAKVHSTGDVEWTCPATGAMHAAVVLDTFDRCQEAFLDFLGVRPPWQQSAGHMH